MRKPKPPTAFTRQIPLHRKMQAPTHPGIMLRKIMARLDLSEAYVAAHAKMPQSDVGRLLAGQLPIDRKIKRRLLPLFGATANMLYRQQLKYNSYQSGRSTNREPAVSVKEREQA